MSDYIPETVNLGSLVDTDDSNFGVPTINTNLPMKPANIDEMQSRFPPTRCVTPEVKNVMKDVEVKNRIAEELISVWRQDLDKIEYIIRQMEQESKDACMSFTEMVGSKGYKIALDQKNKLLDSIANLIKGPAETKTNINLNNLTTKDLWK